MIAQLPEPALAKDIGVVAWLLMVVVVTGSGTMAWLLKRIVDSMDRMVVVQEKWAMALQALSERVNALEEDVEESVAISRNRSGGASDGR